MICQEIAFANGTCRVDISDRTVDKDMPLFAVHMWLVDADRATRHALLSHSGAPVELHAASEALALSSATTFLAGRFGALSEYAHGCADFDTPLKEGDPVIVEV